MLQLENAKTTPSLSDDCFIINDGPAHTFLRLSVPVPVAVRALSHV